MLSAADAKMDKNSSRTITEVKHLDFNQFSVE